ncbi:hypothetical protein BST27_14975 [Mycobacterium intermedium]|uniref:Uncharacterized protein n=1 Tax=Mycobacterium intermedium TaxID=28445 RepID=A0A1E3SEX8_MYCIE|nr:hypothetical protein [Mycobacterium intermedium]MCV6963105.1 hypothetical protein [Mycobacterium intermedium]ODR00697.1 hypothetical protein BHQ20_11970 [Mycobacterium intermedium]OPE52317.1 hypothetical protein BV508_02955 [Mycobacterium intermedium]ORB03644.1 hypothetical protein BST27_14975 [Mycobacterium intermedium]
MNIVPAAVEQQINRVDRQYSLWIGISLAATAAWSFFRIIWTLIWSMSYGWFVGSLAVNFVVWGVIGAVAAIGAVGFLNRYFKGPGSERV